MAFSVERDHTWTRVGWKLNSTLRKWWVCGVCYSPLVERVVEGEFGVYCSKSTAHPSYLFITKAQEAHREHQERVYALNAQLSWKEARRIMPKLKDRHLEDGSIKTPRLAKVGKVTLGRREGNRMYSHPYFTFIPFTEVASKADAILERIRATVGYYNPGQDTEHPTVLTITLLSSDDDVYQSSAYKLKGSGGITRCMGDGESILWMLGPENIIRVSEGQATADFEDQGVTFVKGVETRCPGRSKEGRWPWCAKCKAEMTIRFALFGAESIGIWQMTTTDSRFYDEFWTAIQVLEGVQEGGAIKSIVAAPLEMQRTPPAPRNIPLNKGGGTKLIQKDMPGLSIQVLPSWLEDRLAEIALKRQLEAGQKTARLRLMGGQIREEVLSRELPDYDDIEGEITNLWGDFYRAVITHLRTPHCQFRTVEDVQEAMRKTSDGQLMKANEYWERLVAHVKAHEPRESEPASEDDVVEAEVAVVDEATTTTQQPLFDSGENLMPTEDEPEFYDVDEEEYLDEEIAGQLEESEQSLEEAVFDNVDEGDIPF